MTLLDPDTRDLYTDALRAPAGMRFDEGLGLTYSVDLDTLLTVPLHLLVYASERGEDELLSSGVGLLDALRKISSRLRVYCQRGRIRAPSEARSLFCLLERVAVEVEPPAGQGSFHPKVWLLRFQNEEEDQRHLRLLVLSRNVTADPSWDLVLRLEGSPGEEAREDNRSLARLIRRLPALADGAAASVADGPDHERLAEELVRAEWEPPGAFDRVRFHVAGLADESWLPAPSERLAVVSPFCGAAALKQVVDTTRAPKALVSRPEELQELDPAALAPFEQVYVLDEMAEREDLEAEAAAARGLHAKVYVAEADGRTHLYVGSANATNAALLGGRNVEVMAELVGDTGRVGGIEALLDPESLRGLLSEWLRPEEPLEVDDARRRAEDRLEAARRTLAGAGLSLTCERDDDRWRLTVIAREAFDLEGVADLALWPVTIGRERAVDGRPLLAGKGVELPVGGLGSLTGLVAFRIEAEDVDLSQAFVLNVPVDGLPRRERDAAVVRGIIRDRESFLRYLLLLLGELDPDDVLDGAGASDGILDGGWASAVEELPLLEEMTRAYCRDPQRLQQVRDLLEDLGALSAEDGLEDRPDVVPATFRELWATFEAALEEGAA